MLIKKVLRFVCKFCTLPHTSTEFSDIFVEGKRHRSRPAQVKPALFTRRLRFAASALMAPIPSHQVKTLYHARVPGS